MSRRPDFLVVGAPKCGTTSLHQYLRQHPQIYMPAVKELNYFGRDRVLRHTPTLTLDEYLSTFTQAPDGVRIGEASVSYLRSMTAAREIAAFSPGAQAIIMLRDPVEVMHALHSELVFLGVEEIVDFAGALEAEPDRTAGRRIPAALNNVRAVLYRDAVRFAEQVERYVETLGRENLHVIVFDDFRDRTAASVGETFRFLRVDDTFQPVLDIANPAKVARSKAVQRLLSAPPLWLRHTLRQALPRPARKRLYRRAMTLNARPHPRPPMDPALRRELVIELRPEVERLGAVIGRDLSAWTRP